MPYDIVRQIKNIAFHFIALDNLMEISFVGKTCSFIHLTVLKNIVPDVYNTRLWSQFCTIPEKITFPPT